MSDLDDFLNQTLPRQVNAEEAIHNGDPAPRLAIWSTQDPVTLFGAATTKNGSDEVRQFVGVLASRSSHCTADRYELVAAGARGGAGLHRGL